MPAPIALKPVTTSTANNDVSPGSSPPHLVAEAPVAAVEPPASASASPASTSTLSFEESLARFRTSAQDSEIMSRIAQLNSLSSFWGTPTMTEFR
ncbi:unnamed protein product [Cylicostephanus goldi]|uniref:Uncharacterized protein n=1 Tax=Cylicostephanus goldi TaxID=71465 RepID=A0A3P6RBZ8_CYLGO|nr:unnamed protein product [Cylicostephanus goldi]